MKVLVTGASGLLGHDIAKVFSENHEVHALQGRKELDLTDTSASMHFIAREQPDLIIHSAGFRMVDDAEREQEKTIAINVLAAKNMALAAEKQGIPLVHVSSDSVFNGETERPYHEYDKPDPVNLYGYSKMMAEQEVRTYCRKHFIIRVPLLFGAHGHPETNYIYRMKEQLEQGKEIEYTTDQLCSPTYCIDVANAILKMVQTDYYGIYHIANKGTASRYEFYKTCAELLGLDTKKLKPILQAEKPARRAKNTMFSSIAFKNTFHMELPEWKSSLAQCIHEILETNVR